MEPCSTAAPTPPPHHQPPLQMLAQWQWRYPVRDHHATLFPRDSWSQGADPALMAASSSDWHTHLPPPPPSTPPPPSYLSRPPLLHPPALQPNSPLPQERYTLADLTSVSKVKRLFAPKNIQVLVRGQAKPIVLGELVRRGPVFNVCSPPSPRTSFPTNPPSALSFDGVAHTL